MDLGSFNNLKNYNKRFNDLWKGRAMKKIIITFELAALFMGAIFSIDSRIKNIWAVDSTRILLQVASCSTLACAKKEIDRLTDAKIQAQYTIREDRSKKKWYIVYIDQFRTREEAIRYGNQLIQKGLIQTFIIFPEKLNNEISLKTKETPFIPPIPSKKESITLAEKNPIYFGPIVVKEEESGIRIIIFMGRRIFPEITSDKIADGSRLLITFKNINRYIVPIEFDKIQSKGLLSFNLNAKGSDCIFSLLLNSSYNYKVSQDYFEKEKIYSLLISREPAAESTRTREE
jgi:hypothetical protein